MINFKTLINPLILLSLLSACQNQTAQLEPHEIKQISRINCFLQTSDTNLRNLIQNAKLNYDSVTGELSQTIFAASGSIVSKEYEDWFFISPQTCDKFQPIITNFVRTNISNEELKIKSISKSDYIKAYKEYKSTDTFN